MCKIVNVLCEFDERYCPVIPTNSAASLSSAVRVGLTNSHPQSTLFYSPHSSLTRSGVGVSRRGGQLKVQFVNRTAQVRQTGIEILTNSLKEAFSAAANSASNVIASWFGDPTEPAATLSPNATRQEKHQHRQSQRGLEKGRVTTPKLAKVRTTGPSRVYSEATSYPSTSETLNTNSTEAGSLTSAETFTASPSLEQKAQDCQRLKERIDQDNNRVSILEDIYRKHMSKEYYKGRKKESLLNNELSEEAENEIREYNILLNKLDKVQLKYYSDKMLIWDLQREYEKKCSQMLFVDKITRPDSMSNSLVAERVLTSSISFFDGLLLFFGGASFLLASAFFIIRTIEWHSTRNNKLYLGVNVNNVSDGAEIDLEMGVVEINKSDEDGGDRDENAQKVMFDFDLFERKHADFIIFCARIDELNKIMLDRINEGVAEEINNNAPSDVIYKSMLFLDLFRYKIKTKKLKQKKLCFLDCEIDLNGSEKHGLEKYKPESYRLRNEFKCLRMSEKIAFSPSVKTRREYFDVDGNIFNPVSEDVIRDVLSHPERKAKRKVIPRKKSIFEGFY